MANQQTIQRIPRGLLDALGMKGTGTSPSELQSQLQPAIDVSLLYLQDNFEAQALATGTVNAPGSFAASGSTVPPGEIWLMQHVSFSSTVMGAGESYLDMRVVLNLNTFNCVLMSPNTASANVGERLCLGWDMPSPRILQPNDSFGVYVRGVTAGAHAVTCYASYYRLLI